MTFWSCYNNKKNIKGKKGQQASRHMVEEDTKKKKRERTKTNKMGWSCHTSIDSMVEQPPIMMKFQMLIL